MIVLPTTYTTKTGVRVRVCPEDESGEWYSLEYLDAEGEVTRYRSHVPSRTVSDLMNLEGWTR